MSNMSYTERAEVYNAAINRYGMGSQCIVALEELSECQKEICKFLRGKGNIEHLAEEVADATIMLEQLRIMFDLNDLVCQVMDEKVQRLADRIRADDSPFTDADREKQQEEMRSTSIMPAPVEPQEPQPSCSTCANYETKDGCADCVLNSDNRKRKETLA